MSILSRQAILECNDLPRKRLNIPEWGGDVFIRVITVEELSTMIDVHNHKTAHNENASLVAIALCDEQGQRLFSDEDIALLSHKNALVMGRICKEILELNHIGDTEAIKKD